MKKLTKKSLDELAKTMSVIDKSEQDSFWGMYNNDCFWRCIAYMESGKITEAAAASYALDYYTNAVYGGNSGSSSYANSYLTENTAGMSSAEIRSYIQYAMKSGSYTTNSPSETEEYIAYFNTSNISGYVATSSRHAVIVERVNSDGSLSIFDPQNNSRTTISSSEANFVNKVMY